MGVLILMAPSLESLAPQESSCPRVQEADFCENSCPLQVAVFLIAKAQVGFAALQEATVNTCPLQPENPPPGCLSKRPESTFSPVQPAAGVEGRPTIGVLLVQWCFMPQQIKLIQEIPCLIS